jgi:type VI secretion system protein ImpK
VNSDDPFADFDTGEVTIMKPIPGGGRLTQAPPASQAAQPIARGAALDLPEREGLNPLETAAAPLLDLVAGLKNTHSHPDVAGLHRQLVQELQTFESKARKLGAQDEQTLTRARYVICATLDDIILNTPWSQQFGWAKKTLQGTFFKKEWAGDEFFKLLDKLMQDPSNNRDLLELMYICISLGFKGGYRLYDRQSELEDKREQMYRALRGLRGDFEPELSPRWRGVIDRQNPIIRNVPLWVIMAIGALLLLLLFIALNLRLNSVSDPVFADLLAVRGEIPLRPEAEFFPQPKAPPPPQDEHQTLRERLLSEPCLNIGDVIVGQGAQKQTVGTFISTNPSCGGLFPSGKWDVDPAFNQLLLRIGTIVRESLSNTASRILVTGHTDNIPGRFISNAELSQRRAEAAMSILSGAAGNPSRFRAEGRGDTEPVADNSTAEGRERNRRVVIMVLYPHVVI